MSTTDTAPSFSVTRILKAPVKEAWRAWSDPEQIKQWWGPNGFSGSVAEVDFRDGGTTLVGMRMQEGPEFFNTWSYVSIDEPRRIEFVSRFADRDGTQVAPGEIGLPPELPQEVRHVVTLTPVGGTETELTVAEFGYETGPLLEMSKAGQEQVLDKMAALFERS